MKNLGAQDDLVVVAGAGGFIGGHLVADLQRPGYRRLRAVDIKPLESGISSSRTSTIASSTCGVATPARRRCAAPGSRLQPRLRHGRHGIHRDAQGRVHDLGADQHPHADGGARSQGASASSIRLRRACTRPTSRRPPTSAAEGGGRVSGDAGGRVRVGEAVRRAHVPALHARISVSRRASPVITTSTARSVPMKAAARRRRRRSAAKSSPHSCPARTRSKCGATANRRGASCTSTTA